MGLLRSPNTLAAYQRTALHGTSSQKSARRTAWNLVSLQPQGVCTERMPQNMSTNLWKVTRLTFLFQRFCILFLVIWARKYAVSWEVMKQSEVLNPLRRNDLRAFEKKEVVLCIFSNPGVFSRWIGVKIGVKPVGVSFYTTKTRKPLGLYPQPPGKQDGGRDLRRHREALRCRLRPGDAGAGPGVFSRSSGVKIGVKSIALSFYTTKTRSITTSYNKEEYARAREENRELCYLPKISAHILRRLPLHHQTSGFHGSPLLSLGQISYNDSYHLPLAYRAGHGLHEWFLPQNRSHTILDQGLWDTGTYELQWKLTQRRSGTKRLKQWWALNGAFKIS